jgi:transposase-like protein
MPTPRSQSPFNRPRWTAADAREVLAALERSAQPVSKFAAGHGLDPQRLYVWRRRLRASSAKAEPTTFQELTVGGSRLGRAVGPEFEIVLASGTVVRVPAPFDEEALALLLQVLARVGAC